MAHRPSAEEIREHYDIERELALRLRHASKTERRTLYTTLYEELFRRVPWHSQLMKKTSPALRKRQVALQLGLIDKFLEPGMSFLEIGAGDCALVFEVSKRAESVYAVEISPTIASGETTPDNFQLLLSDGCNIPVADDSIDVVYSNQLMEHLHPDDAMEQLGDVFRTVAPQGLYICITPNSLSGPHDISRHFDEVATGFHLKEYTAQELIGLFEQVGFGKTTLYACLRGYHFRLPKTLVIVLERLLMLCPSALRRKLASSRAVRPLIDIRLVARKL